MSEKTQNHDIRSVQVIPLWSQMPEWWKDQYNNASSYIKIRRYVINRARDVKYFVRAIYKRLFFKEIDTLHYPVKCKCGEKCDWVTISEYASFWGCWECDKDLIYDRGNSRAKTA